jgi:galactose-1-phosphate uridylyltransferase
MKLARGEMTLAQDQSRETQYTELNKHATHPQDSSVPIHPYNARINDTKTSTSPSPNPNLFATLRKRWRHLAKKLSRYLFQNAKEKTYLLLVSTELEVLGSL